MSNPIMMGRPVVPNKREEEVGRSLGVDISDPYDNSIKEECGGCTREVWVGPLQQKQRRDLNGDATVLCPTCTVKYVALHADEVDTMEVTSLGNHHPRGN